MTSGLLDRARYSVSGSGLGCLGSATRFSGLARWRSELDSFRWSELGGLSSARSSGLGGLGSTSVRFS